MTLLSNNASHPECLCPGQFDIASSDELCNDGISRFTGLSPSEKWFVPIEALSDGILDSNLRHGYFPLNPNHNIRITLDQAAEVSASY